MMRVVAEPRHENDRHIRIEVLRGAEDFVSVAVGHFDVGDDEVRQGGLGAGEQFSFLRQQFADFAGDIRGGERIDAQAFASLSQDLLGLGGELFGGSQRFIDLRSEVLELAEQARRNAADAGELPEFAALRGEVERLREGQAKSNEDTARRDEERQQTLEDILATLRGGSTPAAGGGTSFDPGFAFGGATLRSLF